MAKAKKGSRRPVRKRRKGLKADYQGATPRQVAEAVLRYRPPEGVNSRI